MYFSEWLFWQAKTAPQQTKTEHPNTLVKKIHIYQEDIREEENAATEQSSERPRTRGPIYALNNEFLEIRSGMWESKRGLIMLLSLAVFLPIFGGSALFMLAAQSFIKMYQGHIPPQYHLELFSLTLYAICTITLTYLYIKYGLIFSRLEAFTSRHIIIRFNRITQQVYVHRPRYCGGIVTLPWSGVTSTGSREKPNDVVPGVPLLLCWAPEHTGTHHCEFAFVGKGAAKPGDIHAEWEFIRCFMAEGPENLPRPHITSHFPWPWQAFTAQFEGLDPYFRQSGWVIRIGLFMISPAFLVIGLAHWISLLLCWKPRWPKVIREAGRPGKPVPPLTTLADYPAHIQETLRENAEHMLDVRPGKSPGNKRRYQNIKSDSKA